MRITPEAQAVLDRAQPDRLDSLWYELLASDYGALLLEAWDLQIEQIAADFPAYEISFEELVRRASLLTSWTAPLCSAEGVVEHLLSEPRSGLRKAVGPLLEQFRSVDGRLHELDHHLPYALAFEEGLTEPQERHYLQVARQASPVVDQFLRYCNAPLPELTRPYSISSNPPGELECLHLALACVQNHFVVEWLRRMGIAKWRLHNTIVRLDDRIGRSPIDRQRLRWLKPASEEARLLGHAEVGVDHLLLAIISEPRSLSSRVLQDNGVDLKALLRRLSTPGPGAVPVPDMVFQPALLEVCQAACREGREDPFAEELFWALLEHNSYPEIPKHAVQADLRFGMEGWLPKDPRLLNLDGIRLGMSEPEVEEVLGVPFREEGQWAYRDTCVGFHEGQVSWIVGDCLHSPLAQLSRGAGWLEAERALGTLLLWGYDPKSPVGATVHRGKVQVLTLSDWSKLNPHQA